MPAAFARELTQAYEAKPRGQRYFKKEEVEALVDHLAAMAHNDQVACCQGVVPCQRRV